MEKDLNRMMAEKVMGWEFHQRYEGYDNPDEDYYTDADSAFHYVCDWDPLHNIEQAMECVYRFFPQCSDFDIIWDDEKLGWHVNLALWSGAYFSYFSEDLATAIVLAIAEAIGG